jgi:hypothetical protein
VELPASSLRAGHISQRRRHNLRHESTRHRAPKGAATSRGADKRGH